MLAEGFFLCLFSCRIRESRLVHHYRYPNATKLSPIDLAREEFAMRSITSGKSGDDLADAVSVLRTAKKVAALTGAGISVASGIPDFRSPGGLWSVFSPEEYATLDLFYRHPDRAWELYRVWVKC